MPPTDAPQLLEYHHPSHPPHASLPPRPGFLMNASFLISIFVTVASGMIALAVGIRDARSKHDLILPCVGLALAIAVFALEIAAYYRRSIIASFILALAYLLPPAYFLRLLNDLPGGVNSPDFPVVMAALIPPSTLSLIAASAHLLWSRRLHHWKRARREVLT